MIEPPQSVDSISDGDLRIMLTEDHLSWMFTNNIVYNIFQGINHSVFKSDATNVSVSFSNNVYNNPYNTPINVILLFNRIVLQLNLDLQI